MSGGEDEDDRTEEPSERRLDAARKRGDVPGSREVSGAMGVFALFAVVVWLGPRLMPEIAGHLSGVIGMAGDIEIGQGPAGLADLAGVLGAFASPLLPLVGTVFVVLAVAAILGQTLQGETVVSAERLNPKLSNLSPAAGLKRIYSTAALIEFLKNLLKLALVGAIAVPVAWLATDALLPGVAVLPEHVLAIAASEAARMLAAVAAALIPIAIADVLWKRFQWLKKNRMTLKEVRDEHKDSEGSPEVKARRARIRDEQARKRLRKTVPQATVVLMNPTHYAVALRYDRTRDPAPVCVAKGVDAVALRIRALAEEAEVPVIENRPLARALHAAAELDRVIPDEHWQAVAQVIAHVLALQARLGR